MGSEIVVKLGINLAQYCTKPMKEHTLASVKGRRHFSLQLLFLPWLDPFGREFVSEERQSVHAESAFLAIKGQSYFS